VHLRAFFFCAVLTKSTRIFTSDIAMNKIGNEEYHGRRNRKIYNCNWNCGDRVGILWCRPTPGLVKWNFDR